MPAAQMMGWNVASKRWFKKHGGKVKAVGCPTLSKMYPTLYVGPTKEGSRSAANQWWRDQLVKYALDASTDRRPHAGYWQAELAQHKARRQWYASQGDQTGQDVEQRQVECIESALAQAALPDPLEAYDTTATLTLPSYKSTDIDAALWADRLARSVKPSQKYSIAGLVGVFLKTRESDTRPGRVYTLSNHLGHFRNFLDSDDIRQVNGLTMVNFKSYILTKVGPERASNVMGTVRDSLIRKAHPISRIPCASWPPLKGMTRRSSLSFMM